MRKAEFVLRLKKRLFFDEQSQDHRFDRRRTLPQNSTHRSDGMRRTRWGIAYKESNYKSQGKTNSPWLLLSVSREYGKARAQQAVPLHICRRMVEHLLPSLTPPAIISNLGKAVKRIVIQE